METKNEGIKMTTPKTKQTHYFAHDGSFGCAEKLVIVVTENFTEEDWVLIELSQEIGWDYTVELLRILTKHRH